MKKLYDICKKNGAELKQVGFYGSFTYTIYYYEIKMPKCNAVFEFMISVDRDKVLTHKTVCDWLMRFLRDEYENDCLFVNDKGRICMWKDEPELGILRKIINEMCEGETIDSYETLIDQESTLEKLNSLSKDDIVKTLARYVYVDELWVD